MPTIPKTLPLPALLSTLLAAVPAAAQHEHHGHEAEPEGAAMDHSAHEAAAAAAAGEPIAIDGLSIPDVEVVTQDGETVRFYSDLVEGKVVAMNFVFTTCTTICPPMGAIFGRLEQTLGDRAGRDVHLISVSVDPTTDTPERLAEWAAKFGRQPGQPDQPGQSDQPGWTLVTGDKATVTGLLEALEVFTPDFEDHAPVVILGNDATGEWTRAYGLAPPDTMAKILESLIDSSPGKADDGAEEGQ